MSDSPMRPTTRISPAPSGPAPFGPAPADTPSAAGLQTRQNVHSASTVETVGSAGRPSPAFVGASWAALLVGGVAFCVGLWNSGMARSEKGFYLTLLLFGMFAAVSLQKSVRDRMENLQVTGLYLGLCWAAVGASLVLLTIGLWNAEMTASEKGFYAMSYALSLFAAVAVQKNVRDLVVSPRPDGEPGEDARDR